MIKAGGRVQLDRKPSPNPKIGQHAGPPQDIRMLTNPISEAREKAKRLKRFADVRDIRCEEQVKPITKTTTNIFVNLDVLRAMFNWAKAAQARVH